MTDPIMLHELEEKAQLLGSVISGGMPEGVGFCLIMFTFGEEDDGWATYVSNAVREDMIKGVEELLILIKQSPPGG